MKSLLSHNVLCCIDEISRKTMSSFDFLDVFSETDVVSVGFTLLPNASYFGEMTGGRYFTSAVDVFDT